LRISRKIYDEILPEKLGGDLYPGHKIKNCFSAAKIRNFRSDVPHWRRCRDDEFDDDDAVYNDNGNGGDHADLHPVQVLKNHLWGYDLYTGQWFWTTCGLDF